MTFSAPSSTTNTVLVWLLVLCCIFVSRTTTASFVDDTTAAAAAAGIDGGDIILGGGEVYNDPMIVRPEDTVLLPPPIKSKSTTNLPILGPIKGYNWVGQSFPNEQFERPIYKNLNRSDQDFWKYVLDEMLLARIPVVFLHGRGCAYLQTQVDEIIAKKKASLINVNDENVVLEAGQQAQVEVEAVFEDINDTPLYKGAGNHCPRMLRFFVDAMRDAGLFNETWSSEVLQVAMWDDTGAYPYNARFDDPPETVPKLDISNPDNLKWFWEHNILLFFETIPSQLWFRIEGRPVIATWNARFFTNQNGNLSRLLLWINLRFQERFGVKPWFIIQEDWLRSDPTLSVIPEGVILGVHSWMKPKHDDLTSVFSYTEYNKKNWGLVAPGFRNPRTIPGCGEACREVTRRNGTTLRTALDEGVKQDSYITLLESWTNMAESGGFYRSDDWTYPTEYINIVRNYTDPEPETLLFQAEGADGFSDTSDGNQLGEYSVEGTDVDIGRIEDGAGGWYVGQIASGEWLEYRDVFLGCGTYRFTARAATLDDSLTIMRLDLGPEFQGDLRSRVIRSTGGVDQYDLFHLGQVELPKGKYNLRLWFESAGGGIRVDWFFLKRSQECTK
mmetsp:Transcript_40986/g.98148  ORF Transcript_40986/g.98148 Transcript_40986/m.98148 type:complete len:614 (-) Transcript_40986:214-2055(-)